MLKRSSKSFLLLTACSALACGVAETGDENVSYRCLAVNEAIDPIGLIGLDLVQVSGTPTIEGPSSSVFSNNLVALSGTYLLAGDAIGGGSVTIDGDVYPLGDVIEDAGTISVTDPTPEVQAAKLSNDNHKIPCVENGGSCKSPVTGYDLSISAKEDVTLSTGTYYFESISINGQGKLSVDGNVVIYLNGPATFNGGSATNPTSDSLELISSSSEEIRLNGGADSEMRIYAPFATVRFAGTQGFKGSALARTLRINGTADLYVTADLSTELGVQCEADEGGSTGGDPKPPPHDLPENLPH